MIAVIVPWLPSDEHRVAAWEWNQLWWGKNFPEWGLVESTSTPYTKGAAAHAGVKMTDAETLVIADADCFVQQVEEFRALVEQVDQGKSSWVVPHKLVHRLTQAASKQLYDEGRLYAEALQSPRYQGCIGGGMTVLSRKAWGLSGGIDPRFQNWGGEDYSFGYALECLVGPPFRGDLSLIHLWHPVQGPKQRMSPANSLLMRRYQGARRSVATMRGILAERGG